MSFVSFLLGQTESPDVTNVAQLGIAGLMGGLWWWERRYSRQREDQLTEAHQEILSQREHLAAAAGCACRATRRSSPNSPAVQQEILHMMQSGWA